MKHIKSLLLLLTVAFTMVSCKYYNFTGTGKIDANSFQVNYFQNHAVLVEPGIERTFTTSLQDLIQNQTSLSLTNEGGDLIYEGEIVEYRISPITATADQRAAQNRLYIAINVRFINNNKPEDDFEKRYSFYYDYGANEILMGASLSQALDVIYERITQDIFNDSLAKW